MVKWLALRIVLKLLLWGVFTHPAALRARPSLRLWRKEGVGDLFSLKIISTLFRGTRREGRQRSVAG